MVTDDGSSAMVDWEIAVEAAARALHGKRAYVVANPSLSNEALFLLKRLITMTGGSGHFRVEMGAEAPLPGVVDLALRADRAANVTGAEMLGFTRSEDPFAGISAGDALVIVDDELRGLSAETVAQHRRADTVIALSTVAPSGVSGIAAHLPIANAAEEEGTFTNLRGRVQRFLQAKAAPGLARPSWFVLADLLFALGDLSGYSTASAVFDALCSGEAAFAGLSYDRLALKGDLITGHPPKDQTPKAAAPTYPPTVPAGAGS